MIDILSLPRRPTTKTPSVAKGLPINSLPGWDNIPLISKLPMLKCPDNHVIFSKNKIGQNFKSSKQEFDTHVNDIRYEYNPLHDPHLKNFYSIERNLKRLRENGEITPQNDVICNLKAFNEYRLQLHKANLYIMKQEFNRINTENRDRILVSHAEDITKRDLGNLEARQLDLTEIHERKRRMEMEREERYKKFLERTNERFQRISALLEMKRTTLEHSKSLNQIRLQQHWDICADLDRKRLIAFKKKIQFKHERHLYNFKLFHEKNAAIAREKELTLWKKRLNQRIEFEDRIQKMLAESRQRRQEFIENHKAKYFAIWNDTQKKIKIRSEINKKILTACYASKISKKQALKKLEDAEADRKDNICPKFRRSLELLMDADLCEVLNKTIEIGEAQLPFEHDDPIYKAAEFILEHIISKFKKDLSCDKVLFKSVKKCVEDFIEQMKQSVFFRATQIIAAREAGELENCKDGALCEFQRTFRGGDWKTVSFSNLEAVIGISSYDIHPEVTVKHAGGRPPTPKGSLTSLSPEQRENTRGKLKTDHLCRDEMIFVQHILIKYKHGIIVGVGKRVFQAIEDYFHKKPFERINEELLRIDKNFIICQAVKGILNYAVKPMDFECSLKLTVNSISADIIWAIQTYMLKPLPHHMKHIDTFGVGDCTDDFIFPPACHKHKG